MGLPIAQFSDIEITPDDEAVIEAIERHDPYIFVSGKAGTGKTTLIAYLHENGPQNLESLVSNAHEFSLFTFTKNSRKVLDL